MSTPIPPPPQELQALFDVERGDIPMPAAARARLWADLSKTLPPPRLPTAPARTPAAPRVANGLGGPLARHALTALVSFGAGGALGHFATARRAELSPTVSVPTQPVAPAPSPASPSEVAVPQEQIAPQPGSARNLDAPAAVAAKPASRKAMAPPPDNGGFEREQALIETARTALGRGDGTGALRLLDQHASGYPHGGLAEESETLRIQALLSIGQRDQARVAAEAFKVKYPKSLMLQVIDQSIAQSASPGSAHGR